LADTTPEAASAAYPWRSGLDPGAEHITAAPHGLDERRDLRIGFDFPAEPADLNVDAPVEDVGIAAARYVEKLVAGEDMLGVLNKGQ
jgi:hypothetical protein